MLKSCLDRVCITECLGCNQNMGMDFLIGDKFESVPFCVLNVSCNVPDALSDDQPSISPNSS